jgi:ribosomal protein L16/L10AE
MALALLPYSFLTYSTQIPSRQTYLASAGLAALFGLAMAKLRGGTAGMQGIALALALIVAAQNVSYLWIRKRAQFVARAQPTEELIRMARAAGGPIWVKCFPLAPITAQAALRIGAGLAPGEIEWSEAEAAKRPPRAIFCGERSQ